MSSIPSHVTVPVKVDAKPSIGFASILGAGGTLGGASGSILAYALGDRSPETVAAIVGGLVVAVASLLATLAGRFAQSHAMIANGLGAALAPAVRELQPAPITVPVGAPSDPNTLAHLGNAAVSGLTYQPVTGYVDNSVGRLGELLERIARQTAPSTGGSDQSETEEDLGTASDDDLDEDFVADEDLPTDAQEFASPPPDHNTTPRQPSQVTDVDAPR